MTIAEYLKEKLDTGIPELAAIPGLIDAGRQLDAERIYAGFVRTHIDPERFFSLPEPAPENVWKLPGETDADVCRRLLANTVMSCNYMHDFGEAGIQWEANPTPNGYAEWTWQLNRHHEFIAVARHYRETGDPQAVECFLRLWRSWRAQCVCPEEGPGYLTKAFRTIEIGIRLRSSWHYALHAFFRDPAFTDHDLCDMFAALWENAERLRRLHRPAGNWVFMEMAGLYVTAVLYPWVNAAAEWKTYALGVLRAELGRQFYPDGFHIELTTNYHFVAIRNTLDIVNIARVFGEPPLTELLKMLEPAFEAYVKLSDPSLHTPDLNDGAAVDVAAVCGIAAELFPERADFKYFAARRAEGKPPAEKDSIMPYSGIAVLRDDWSADSQWAFFESGPFGLGHQHEDKLNFSLYAFGRPLLRDTGSFAYDRSQMRQYVLSAASHDTVLVDGLGQNRRGRYRWHEGDLEKLSDLRVQLSTGTDPRLNDGTDTLHGSYGEGFGPEYVDVRHERTVVKVKNRPLGLETFYLIVDRLTAADGQTHSYEAIWQLEDVPLSMTGGKGSAHVSHELPSYSTPQRRGSRLTADYGDNVTLTLISGENCTVRTGSLSPFMGWRTPDVPAPSIVLTACAVNARIVTLLYPSANGCPIERIEYDPAPEQTDVTVVTPEGRWTWTETPLD